MQSKSLTQAVRKFSIEALSQVNFSDFGLNSIKDLRPFLLTNLFRRSSFATYNQNVRALLPIEYTRMASNTKIPVKIIYPIIKQFLVELVYFRRDLRKHTFSYDQTTKLNKLIVYLLKIHQLAPVFDFDRAKENARILKIKLQNLCFFPQFMTQIAIVVFVTDLNDKKHDKRIIQANLRLLCDCSAYSFHRTRNKLGLG